MPNQITKRDGSIVPFDSNKIYAAVYKASNVVKDVESMTANEIMFITEQVVKMLNGVDTCSIEDVQDFVEKALVKFDFPNTAKEYIIYRNEHNKIRNNSSYLMDIYKKLTYNASSDEDIKRENANIDGDTAMGTMLKYGSEGSKFFIDNYILPKDISAAHANGDIHIHDKDFYMLTETCCQIDLIKLFKDGFSTGHGYLREPNAIESYSALACIAIQADQNEMHGGQSVPHFDYCMAPGVVKTYRQEFKRAFITHMTISNKTESEDIETIYSNILDSTVMDKLIGIDDTSRFIDTDIVSIFSVVEVQNKCGITDSTSVNDACAYARKEALKRTTRRTYQAMEALVHNLNTMSSRAGAQVPFSSLNYGTDTSTEGRMVVRQLLMATEAGLGNGETSIFPVQIFKLKSGVNYNPEDPNYDLFKLAMETSAKRLFPNFSNIDAPFNLQYYDGSYNSEVAYMGCRTRVIGNTYDPTQQVTLGRGNLSFTTINLPRLGIEAHGDTDKFFNSLDNMMELVSRQLLHRLKIQGAKKIRNYPFLMGEGIWLGSDKLDPDDTIYEILRHGTLTIGFIGLAETLVALTGKHHGESPESQELGIKIIKHMRDFCDAESEKRRLNFSLIATPAESLSGRFVTIDKQKYGAITGVTDRDYYTNSFHRQTCGLYQ